jgi:hypothetical protein
MPDLPQTINLPQITKEWSPELLRNWTLMIQTLNALSRVDTAANKPALPDLDHIFFTESDGSEITYIAVSGVWRALAGGGGGLAPGGLFAPGSFAVATGQFRIANKRQQFTTTQRLALAGTSRLSIIN